MSKKEKTLSVVVPVYRAGENFEALVKQTLIVCQQFKAYRLILVDDASGDNSFMRIKALAKENANIVGIALTKNVGQQMAIFAGLTYANGDYTAIIDDDFQQNPNDILALYDKIEKGYDVVYGINSNAEVSSGYRNWGTYIREKTINGLSNKDPKIKVCSFRLMTRNVVDAVKKADTRFIYITMEVLKHTKNIANVAVQYKPRHLTRYNIVKFIAILLNLHVYYGEGLWRIFKRRGNKVDIMDSINGEEQ